MRASSHACILIECCVAGGKVEGLELPKRVFPCASPAEVRSTLPEGKDVLAFQCRNPIHKAHYELFTRALDAPNVGEGAVCLVHPTCGPTQVLATNFGHANSAALSLIEKVLLSYTRLQGSG